MHPPTRRTLSSASFALVATVVCMPAHAGESPLEVGASRRANPIDVPPAPPARDPQQGRASFYAKHFDGKKTASGERYDPNALTAAHRTLPLGTQVRVVNPKNDRSVVVTVNDRGPVSRHRMIDVSSAAADELGMKRAGVTKVETQVVGKDASTR